MRNHVRRFERQGALHLRPPEKLPVKRRERPRVPRGSQPVQPDSLRDWPRDSLRGWPRAWQAGRWEMAGRPGWHAAMMRLSAAVVERAATRWHTPAVHRFVVVPVSIDAPFTAVFIRYLQMSANAPGQTVCPSP